MPTMTLTVAVISRNHEIRQQIAAALEKDFAADTLWVVPDYPAPAGFTRLRDATAG